MLHNFERYLEKNPEYETNHLKVLYYDLEKNYKGTYRSYEYSRICTILNGTKHVTINQGEQFVYSPSEFILIPPHSSVEMDIKENTKAVVYEVSDQLINNIRNQIQTKYDTDLLIEDRNKIKRHKIDSILSPIRRINKFFTSDDPDKAFLIDLTTQELVYQLIKHNFIPDNYILDVNDPVEYILHYMKNHIDEVISLQELASRLNISPSNLSSKFKQSTGFTPKEYLHLIKLKKAREELQTKSVTEVCYALGYENISYFIHLFKKHYGETPKKYAQRIAQHQQSQHI